MLTFEESEFLVEDFIKLKKRDPYKTWRTNSKGINFSFIFGSSAFAFKSLLRDQLDFQEKDCDLFIREAGLTSEFQKRAIGKNQAETLDLKYLIVSEAMRNGFFSAYPGLWSRVVREMNFALSHGYTRTMAGPVRHLPELIYMNINPKTNKGEGYDKKFNAMIKHLLNQSANSNIQTLETTEIFPAITVIQRNLVEWGFKSRIFNTVHDSLDVYAYNDELPIVVALIQKMTSKVRAPRKPTPLYMVAEISDLTQIDKQYYKHGIEKEGWFPNLEEEIQKYNDKFGTNIKFVDYETENVCTGHEFDDILAESERLKDVV